MRLMQFLVICCLLVVSTSHGSADSGEADYSRAGNLRSLKLTAERLQDFVNDTRAYVERAIPDIEWIPSPIVVPFSSSWGDVTVSGSTLAEIFARPDCPDPLDNIKIWIHGVSRSPNESISAEIDLGPRGNRYWISGTDKILVYSLEASVFRLAERNGTWIRPYFRYAFVVLLYWLAAIFFYDATSTKRSQRLPVSLGAVSLCLALLFSFWRGLTELFTPFELWKTSEVGFFDRYTGHFVFFGLLIASLGLVVSLYTVLRSPSQEKTPVRRHRRKPRER
jgi:hypothetical protein